MAKSYQRINVRVPVPVNDKLDYWAAQLGLTKSQLSAICIQAGLGAILRAVSPEDAFSPEAMAKIVSFIDRQDQEASGVVKK